MKTTIETLDFPSKINKFEDLNKFRLILQKKESNTKKLLDHIALQN